MWRKGHEKKTSSDAWGHEFGHGNMARYLGGEISPLVKQTQDVTFQVYHRDPHLNRNIGCIWMYVDVWKYGIQEFFFAFCASKVTSFCGFLVAFASILVLVAKVTWWQMACFCRAWMCQNPAHVLLFWFWYSSGKFLEAAWGQHWL